MESLTVALPNIFELTCIYLSYNVVVVSCYSELNAPLNIQILFVLCICVIAYLPLIQVV